MASEKPPEWDEWMDSLGEESVRTLSALLLVDLLQLETDPKAMEALAADLGALAEDLLMAGDFFNAATVVKALSAREGRDDGRAARASAVQVAAVQEAVAALA